MSHPSELVCSMYADGALGSRGAALLQDYSDDPGNRGLLVTPPEEIESMAELVTSHGDDVVVEQPDELRAAVVTRLRRLAEANAEVSA